MGETNGPSLKPFIRYFGGKWRIAPRYPRPRHGIIIEPFAGAAGYSLRYPHLAVTLVEKYGALAEMWRYLIAVPEREIARIPLVESVLDLPSWVPQPARDMVGFCMNDAAARPGVTLSSGRKSLRAAGRNFEGWGEGRRHRVATQLKHIRHWRVIHGDYTEAPDTAATWFIDPPYEKAGAHYVNSSKDIDYGKLAAWCLSRKGQVMVCENDGASWLPFSPYAVGKTVMSRCGSHESMFYFEN